MMKRIKMFCLILGMSAMVIACGKDEKASTENPSTEISNSETENLETKPEDNADEEVNTAELKECTYLNIAPDSRYMIDMVEYPDWDSGEGKLEDLDNGLYLGVANYSNLTILLCENAILENVKAVTDIPTVMEEPIARNFTEAAMPIGGKLSIYTFKGLKYSTIEDIGEVNGYQMCRFEGTYVIDDAGTEREYAVCGYATFLKQSGYPIYVSTIDVSEEQSNVDKLDKVAYDCIKTLRELTEEEVRALGY